MLELYLLALIGVLVGGVYLQDFLDNLDEKKFQKFIGDEEQ